MKWSAVFAMVALLVVGVWLVVRDDAPLPLRADSKAHELRLDTMRGALEHRPADDTFRVVFRDSDQAAPVLDRATVERVFGKDRVAALTLDQPNFVFKLFNITSWGSFAWVLLGLLGQVAFFLRMFAQWIVSEKRKETVVPEIFWWLSFFGGVALFTYFVWRKELVGVLGQTTGVVIYARNLRLIHKQRRRLAEATKAGTSPA